MVLIDATNPFGNERLLPRGILREPIGSIDRATHVVLTRCDLATDLPGLLTRLQSLCPELPVRTTRHAPTALRPLSDDESKPLETIRGERVKAVCGIANPDAFVRTLEELGAVVEEYIFLPRPRGHPRGGIRFRDTGDHDGKGRRAPPRDAARRRDDGTTCGR